MNRFKLFCAAAALALAGASDAQSDELQAGDEAPAFSLPGSDGETYALEDFRDKQVVILAWFPKAFTGG